MNGVVFRIKVHYSTDGAMPCTLILKCVGENLRPSAEREILFYNTLCKQLPVCDALRVPQCYWAAMNVPYRCDWKVGGPIMVPTDTDVEPCEPGTAAVLLMEDVGEHDLRSVCGLGDPDFESWSYGNIRLTDALWVVEKLAILHAAWWARSELTSWAPLQKHRAYTSNSDRRTQLPKAGQDLSAVL